MEAILDFQDGWKFNNAVNSIMRLILKYGSLGSDARDGGSKMLTPFRNEISMVASGCMLGRLDAKHAAGNDIDA